jgi:hypothetical protein
VLNRNPLTDTVSPTASPLNPETCSHLISDTCSTVIDVTGGVASVNICRRNRREGKNWMHGRTCSRLVQLWSAKTPFQRFFNPVRCYILIAWRGGPNFLFLNLSEFKGIRAG